LKNQQNYHHKIRVQFDHERAFFYFSLSDFSLAVLDLLAVLSFALETGFSSLDLSFNESRYFEIYLFLLSTV
jgi:hypothetical protein